jgi:predicted dehydrogenase
MRVGIVGAGAMGSVHTAGWAQTEAEIAGIFDAAQPAARTLADRYGVRTFPDLAALLAAVDVVDLCTPTHLHHPLVLQVAAAGKHVLCEKPLARTLADGREMVTICRRAGVKLMVAHVIRFFPEYRQAKEAVDAGRVGQVAVMRLKRNVYQPKKAEDNWFVDFDKSGGLILDLMIHDFEYARWVAGEVTTVFAKSIRTQHPDARSDHGLAILTHASGALSLVEGSWAYPPPTFRTQFEIAGSEGLLIHDSEATAPITLRLQQRAGESPDVPLPSSPLLEDPYTTEIKAFYEAVRHDRPVPVSAGDGLAALQIALAAIESTQTGRPVHIEPLAEVAAWKAVVA